MLDPQGKVVSQTLKNMGYKNVINVRQGKYFEIELDEITPKFWRILKQFAPFGPGNMSPLFMSRNLTDSGFGKCVGNEHTHLKCKVSQLNNTASFDVIGFNLGEKLELIQNKKSFSAVYAVDENEWNGNVSLQLKLKDLKEV